MAYNSYLIKDEKNVVLDTIDRNVTDIWLENLEKELAGEKVDYLVISHLEPDHAYNIGLLAKKYPDMKLIGNAMTFNILPNFFDIELTDRKIVVKEGDTLNIGTHTLQFFMAPMVHWPEVMVQALLKKVATLDIQMICPLHGPILKENLAHYIEKYDIWSRYQPETDGVFIACASIYGNTLEAAKKLKEIFEEKGAKKVV